MIDKNIFANPDKHARALEKVRKEQPTLKDEELQAAILKEYRRLGGFVPAEVPQDVAPATIADLKFKLAKYEELFGQLPQEGVKDIEPNDVKDQVVEVKPRRSKK